MQKISKLYTDVSRAGSFSGLSGFLKANKNIKKQEALNFLKTNEAYTLHMPKRKKFKRQKVFVPFIDHLWQIDLIDVSKIKDENKNNTFLLVVIDCFSKMAWITPLLNKSALVVLAGFKEILQKSKRKPKFIQVDSGLEFYNKDFKNFCNKNKIKLYSTFSELKAVIVERFNRTIREKMQRYFTYVDNNQFLPVLDNLVLSYNKSFHRSIKTSPILVTKRNEEKIFFNLYGKNRKDFNNVTINFKFLKDEKVRISKSKTIFSKGYLPNWTIEYFLIDKQIPSIPPTYILKDLLGDILSGIFYEQELQKVEQISDIYRIEEILDQKIINKNKYLLIKWLGWPSKFNSWEPDKNLK